MSRLLRELLGNAESEHLPVILGKVCALTGLTPQLNGLLGVPLLGKENKIK